MRYSKAVDPWASEITKGVFLLFKIENFLNPQDEIWNNHSGNWIYSRSKLKSESSKMNGDHEPSF